MFFILLILLSFLLMLRRTPSSTLFPYTTLFRSAVRYSGFSSTRPASAKALIMSPFHAVRIFSSRPGQTRRERTASSVRSEEHTSELQSRLHLVCRLLPEKKNAGDPVLYCNLPPS